MYVTIEEVERVAKRVNDNIEELANNNAYVKEGENIINSIENLSSLWETSGGKEAIADALDKARELDSNKLSNEIFHLSSEKANYTTKTVDTN